MSPRPLLGLISALILCHAAPVGAQAPRGGPSPDHKPLEAFTGTVGPWSGSLGERVYLALYEPALGERGVVVEVSGRLGEKGLIRLAPHRDSGLLLAEAELTAEELIEVWTATKLEFDADFARAEDYFERSSLPPDSLLASCAASGLIAFIAEDGAPVRRSQGEQIFCRQDGWSSKLAPRFRTLAVLHMPPCAVLPANGGLSDLARSLRQTGQH
ncbi:hypothetical protein BH11PSE2_BH11PSE2_13180 [soil metagenome]